MSGIKKGVMENVNMYSRGERLWGGKERRRHLSYVRLRGLRELCAEMLTGELEGRSWCFRYGTWESQEMAPGTGSGEFILKIQQGTFIP